MSLQQRLIYLSLGKFQLQRSFATKDLASIATHPRLGPKKPVGRPKIPGHRLVNCPKEINTMLPLLLGSRTKSSKTWPSLYIDMEGVDLGRNGSISLLQIYTAPIDKGPSFRAPVTFIVDVHTLGSTAFNSGSPSLKDIFQDPAIPKAFFDVRSDSDALFNLFNIELAGVWDIQLMELATRHYSRKRLTGLMQCIRESASLNEKRLKELEAKKKAGQQLFAPEKGGNYEVLNERPLKKEIVEYAVADVAYLPTLWRKYHGKLTTKWKRKLEQATKERVEVAKDPEFEARDPRKIKGPW